MPDVFQYNPQDNSAAAAALQAEYDKIRTSHVGKNKWYRKYRSWADFWRTTTESSLYGINGTGPTDPLAQLQQQLLQQYEQAKPSANFSSNYNFGNMVNARQRGMTQALQQRAAGMGVGNAYQGTIDASTMARQTLINQSLAAYRPLAYQAQQQVQNSTDELLTAMSQADFEGRKSIAGAGRSV